MADQLYEDLTSLAAAGYVNAQYELFDADWRVARRWLGAMPRLDLRHLPPSPYFAPVGRERHWGPWQGSRSMRVLLDPALASPLPNALTDILTIARQRPYLVSVATFQDSNDVVSQLNCVDVRSGENCLTLVPDDDEVRDVELLATCSWLEDDAIDTHIVVDRKLVRRIARRMRAEGREDAIAGAWALAVHGQLPFDLYVTTDEAALDIRWLGADAVGVVSPDEARSMLHTLTRAHGWAVLPEMGGSVSTSFDDYAMSLAAAMMPTAHDALADSLAPGKPPKVRQLADRLETLIARQADLVQACQRVREAHYLEGYVGGFYGNLRTQMYHVQNALVLASGSADILAWVVNHVAELGFDPESQRRVLSWRGLVGDKNADHRLHKRLRESGSAIYKAMTESDSEATLTLAYDLRDAYQHRHQLRSGLGVIRERSGQYAWRKALVCLDHNLSSKELDRLAAADPPVRGVFVAGASAYLIPYLFLRGLALAVAEVVEQVLQAATWPDRDWVERDFWVQRASTEARLEWTSADLPFP